jgi:hypothetical protein
MTILNLPLKASSDDRTISEASGSILADVWWHDDTPNNKWDADAKARAAEIVRRCNAHDELVEALRGLMNTGGVRLMLAGLAKGVGTAHQDGLAVRAAESALAKVEAR